jgi:alkylation response protein AidB-like acyl-CoA dehydrogenase
MDFHLDDDQLALQDHVARRCRERWPLERIAERPIGALDRQGWDELASAGLLALLVEEGAGGLGLGAAGGVVAFEQLGRHLVPGPWLWSALAALVVPEVAAGRRLASGVDDAGEPPCIVEHAAELDVLLVLRPDGVASLDRAELPPAGPADPLDPHSGAGVFGALPAGTRVGDAACAAQLRTTGTVLAAALQLGVAQAALDVAVAYALERKQFGRPIGSFQALKHLMADMAVRVNLARSATYAAAAVLDDPAVGDVARSVSGAKLLAGEAALENARGAIQVMGGMGFTWEMPPHFLLKRALVLDQTFGTPTSHALALAASVENEIAQGVEPREEVA